MALDSSTYNFISDLNLRLLSAGNALVMQVVDPLIVPGSTALIRIPHPLWARHG